MAKKKRKQKGQYCRRCHRRRANEKFSTKGHTKKICKGCENEKRTELKRKRQIADSKRVATNLFEEMVLHLAKVAKSQNHKGTGCHFVQTSCLSNTKKILIKAL